MQNHVDKKLSAASSEDGNLMNGMPSRLQRAVDHDQRQYSAECHKEEKCEEPKGISELEDTLEKMTKYTALGEKKCSSVMGT